MHLEAGSLSIIKEEKESAANIETQETGVNAINEKVSQLKTNFLVNEESSSSTSSSSSSEDEKKPKIKVIGPEENEKNNESPGIAVKKHRKHAEKTEQIKKKSSRISKDSLSYDRKN